jgi:hypothetical protein
LTAPLICRFSYLSLTPDGAKRTASEVRMEQEIRNIFLNVKQILDNRELHDKFKKLKNI